MLFIELYVGFCVLVVGLFITRLRILFQSSAIGYFESMSISCIYGAHGAKITHFLEKL